MMFPREKHRRFATIDESGRIEFGFAEGEKKKRARRDYNSFDRFERVRCCALNFSDTRVNRSFFHNSGQGGGQATELISRLSLSLFSNAVEFPPSRLETNPALKLREKTRVKRERSL